jgi:hypothetical protein
MCTVVSQFMVSKLILNFFQFVENPYTQNRMMCEAPTRELFSRRTLVRRIQQIFPHGGGPPRPTDLVGKVERAPIEGLKALFTKLETMNICTSSHAGGNLICDFAPHPF